MADKAAHLVLEALTRAAAEPGGVALYANKKFPGLFAATAVGKQAAQQALEHGFLRVVAHETTGKQVHELCAVTQSGLEHLLSLVNPRKVLEDLVDCLETRQQLVKELVNTARQWQEGVAELRATIEHILQKLQVPGGLTTDRAGYDGSMPSVNGFETWMAAVVAHLREWDAAGKSSDCPLPELYTLAATRYSGLSIGHFHDGLRRLHEQGQIYLHPWTGPLYEMPQPSCALLIGHEIAYYASKR